jgi:plastocyanin
MRVQRRRQLAMAAASAVLAVWLMVGAAAGADGTVTMSGLAFDPASVTIEVGDSVTWQNEDGVAHTATGNGGAFDTGTVDVGQSATISFSLAGTFAYVCTIHPTMQGTVIVAAAAPTTAPATAAPAGPTDGVTITPAPTDTVPRPAEADIDAVGLVAGLLAVLGAAMLVGTVAFDRRTEFRDRE